MPAKLPENIAQPILDVARAEHEKAPPSPADKERSDQYVRDLLAAKATVFRRAMARGREQNPKPAA